MIGRTGRCRQHSDDITQCQAGEKGHDQGYNPDQVMQRRAGGVAWAGTGTGTSTIPEMPAVGVQGSDGFQGLQPGTEGEFPTGG
uniref:Uncharacterized protein n=1 Tax=Thermogemmatispora argillosa TaxID=2045280 RepID=A0A455T337_9CHLR|nr:hypothetical protein KTA_24250 [Thermogemmatispora argillosa]